MRDPSRIDEVLAILKDIWVQEPDLRLGQLVVIAAKPAEACPQIFYVEDEQLLSGLRSYQAILLASRKAKT
jgi:uncharacterized protein YihD (DUF1040 family)